MSLARKASSGAKKPLKPRRGNLAAALVEREAELAEARRESTRLFDEVGVCARDLAESLAQQTATAEILRVISNSPTDLQPVLEAIAVRANKLLGGLSTAVFRIFGDTAHLAAFTATNPKGNEALKAMLPPRLARLPEIDSVLVGDSAQIADTELKTLSFEIWRDCVATAAC